MQQRLMQDDAGNVWEVDASGQPTRLAQRAPRAAAPATITSQRDPFDVRRENRADRTEARADARDERSTSLAEDANRRAREKAARDAIQFAERNKPTLPAGYMMGPNGKAVRIPGLPPEKGVTGPKTASEMESVRAEAIDKIRLARSLQQRSRDGWFTTGFGASLAGLAGGSPAYDVGRDTETLKNAGALTRIMEMAATNGGKNPLTPLSNSDFQALASSLSNLDTSQSDEQYQANVQRVIDLYERAYKGAGGTDLSGDLQGQQKKREAVGVNPQAPVGPQGTSFAPSNVVDFAAGLNGGKYAFIEGGGLTYNGKEVPVSEAIANSEPYREAYRAQFGSYPPLTVDVEAGEVTPGAQSALDRQRDTFGGGVDAVGRGIADTFSVGLADPFAAAMNTLTGGGSFADNLIRQRGVSAADERVNFGLRTAGQVIGGFAPVVGATRFGAAALPSRPMLGAGIADTGLGAFYGGASNDKDRVTGAFVGGAAALAGNQFGQRVLAPAFRGVAGSQFGQRIGRGVAAAMDRPFTPPPIRPTAIDRTIAGSANANLDLIRSTLDEAERLGLPMALADTSPQLRTLAGSAVRRSPDARAFAEQALTPRSLGEGGRAIQAIRRDFGPAVNMRDERDGILGAGRAASAPLYDQSYGAPIVSTPELDAVLNTPFGQQAIARARTIAANERRDPTGAGFSLDADGNPVLNPVPINLYQRQAEARSAFDAAQEAHRVALRTRGANTNATRQRLTTAREAMQIADRALATAPAAGTAATQRGYSTQTLDYAKRGMDDILESQRDPITGRLNLDEAGRAQNGVRGQLLSEMDQYNPLYREARSTYQGYARQADALTSGYGATRPSVGVDDLNTMTARLGPAEQARFGQGYSTGLTERIEKQAFTGNPYNAVAGSADDQAKMRLLFPEGTSTFLRQGDLERQMGLTKYETLGGSPTAGRAQADRLLDPAFGVQALAETGLSMATGVPPIGAMAGAVRRGLGERFNATMGQKKAAALAPRLLAPDPAQARAELDAMVQANDAYNMYKRRTNGLLGMFGRGFGLPAATPFLTD